MITPPVFCGIICLPAHLQPRNTPLRLICTTVFQPLIEMSSGLARNEAPALLTMMSSRPHSATARSTIPLTWSSWRTSTATAKVLRPRSVMALATGSRCSSLRLQRATSAPARANSIAIDLPMPVPPPVTMAVLPSRENGVLGHGGDHTPARPRLPAGLGRRCARHSVRGQRDLGLARRHLALDPAPHRHRRQRGAVVLGAARELVERARGPPPRACGAPWRCGAPRRRRCSWPRPRPARGGPAAAPPCPSRRPGTYATRAAWRSGDTRGRAPARSDRRAG